MAVAANHKSRNSKRSGDCANVCDKRCFKHSVIDCFINAAHLSNTRVTGGEPHNMVPWPYDNDDTRADITLSRAGLRSFQALGAEELQAPLELED
ncbi:hypothetical protein TNCV_4524081 [Trichonephila clavipes]|nr:hypothetical protein TNCV_4524081 [Trichonephila clavipes]